MSRLGGRKYDYDLIAIGSGAGGGVAAHLAADRGQKVAIIERDHVGGECPNFGCVPTKALLQAAETWETVQSAGRFGVNATKASFNYNAVRRWKDLAISRTGVTEGAQAYAADGITVIHGTAHFLSPHAISVGGKRYTARNFVIATGTRPVAPPVPGLAQAGYLTYREAIDLKEPPKRIFIIGGGPVGCEFAELFASFGSEVHLAEMAPRLVVGEDPEIGELMKALFEQRGMHVYAGTEVFQVDKHGSSKTVHFRVGKIEQSVTVDEILVAAGKIPNTDLGLENAGVKHDRHGIKVNARMETSAKHIYAAGDVAGPYGFTHMASYQSRIAAHNMFSRDKVLAKYHAVPRCIFTDPEVACVGMTEAQAKAEGIKYETAAVPISILGRANTSDEDTGFVKVMATTGGVIIGAAIMSPRAGEVIHELTLAVSLGLKASDVASTIHAFPTWSEAVRVACAKLA